MTRLIWTAAVVIVATIILSCECRLVGSVEDAPTDNLACNLEDLPQVVLRGRTSLPITMGTCDCTGIPTELECTKTSTGVE